MTTHVVKRPAAVAAGAGLPAWRRGRACRLRCSCPAGPQPGPPWTSPAQGAPWAGLRGRTATVDRAHGSLAGPACHPRDSPAPAASRRLWAQLSTIACKRCYSATHNLTRVAGKRVRANSELPVQNRSRCHHRCSVSHARRTAMRPTVTLSGSHASCANRANSCDSPQLSPHHGGTPAVSSSFSWRALVARPLKGPGHVFMWS